MLHLVIGEHIWGVEKYVLNLLTSLRPDFTPIVAYSDEAVGKRFAEEGIRTVSLPLRSYLHVSAALRLRSFVLENQIDIVHSHLGVDSFLAALALSTLPRVGLVSSMHFLEPSWTRRPKPLKLLWGLIQRLKNSRIEAFLPITPQVADELKKREGVPLDKITVVYPGVKIPAVQPGTRTALRKTLLANDHDILILVACRLQPQKNVPLALHAAAILRDSFPQFKLIIAGEGSQQSLLETIVSSENLQSHVLFVGYLKEVIDMLAAADIFLLPSLAEGFGISAVEAMLASLPVVGLSGSGLNFIVENERTGVLLQDGSSRQLALELQRLCVNKELRQSMGTAGAVRARECFSAEGAARIIEGVYLQLSS